MLIKKKSSKHESMVSLKNDTPGMLFRKYKSSINNIKKLWAEDFINNVLSEVTSKVHLHKKAFSIA